MPSSDIPLPFQSTITIRKTAFNPKRTMSKCNCRCLRHFHPSNVIVLILSVAIVILSLTVTTTFAGQKKPGSVIVINNQGGGGGHCHDGHGSGGKGGATTIVKTGKKGNTIIIKGGGGKKKHVEHVPVPIHVPVPVRHKGKHGGDDGGDDNRRHGTLDFPIFVKSPSSSSFLNSIHPTYHLPYPVQHHQLHPRMDLSPSSSSNIESVAVSSTASTIVSGEQGVTTASPPLSSQPSHIAPNSPIQQHPPFIPLFPHHLHQATQQSHFSGISSSSSTPLMGGNHPLLSMASDVLPVFAPADDTSELSSYSEALESAASLSDMKDKDNLLWNSAIDSAFLKKKKKR